MSQTPDTTGSDSDALHVTQPDRLAWRQVGEGLHEAIVDESPLATVRLISVDAMDFAPLPTSRPTIAYVLEGRGDVAVGDGDAERIEAIHPSSTIRVAGGASLRVRTLSPSLAVRLYVVELA